ncbi:MAG: M48 family metalloprotease [Bacteroidales bacterium]
MQNNNLSRNLILYSLLLIMIYSCARNPVTGRRQLMLMSTKQEIQMGREYDPQVIATFGEYEHEPLMNFIRQQGTEMGKLSHRPDLEYHFRILDSPVINAFAVPGGYMYFTRGILAQFNNEAELVGVLGHEMGHITARHSVSRQSQQQLGQLLLIGGMIASEEFARYGQYAMAGMQLLFLKFSRDDERESDELGAEYASKLGFDAKQMANFFEVLQKMNLENQESAIPNFLSTHPNPEDRYGSVLEYAETWQDSLDFNTWKVNRQSYLSMLDGMVYGEDPRQGYVDGSVFYHPELKFQFPFPAGWQLENLPMQVRIGPSERNALIVFNIVDQNSLQEAAQTTLQQLELEVQQTRNTTVNGMDAISAVSVQTSQNQSTGQPQTIRVMSLFIDDNGTYYAFHGVAPQEVFDQFQPSFEATMMNFDRLSDPSRINVEPHRIRIVKAQNAGTLAEVFRRYNVPEEKMEEYAFLNNMALTDPVENGQMVKVVSQ